MSSTASASGFSAIQTQLSGLKTRADDVKTLLEQQQELLRRRGISSARQRHRSAVDGAVQHRQALRRPG